MPEQRACATDRRAAPPIWLIELAPDQVERPSAAVALCDRLQALLAVLVGRSPDAPARERWLERNADFLLA
jgi:hypothetical protein